MSKKLELPEGHRFVIATDPPEQVADYGGTGGPSLRFGNTAPKLRFGGMGGPAMRYGSGALNLQNG